ncbi:MAG: pyridoxal phosphate-dependent aminotransferase [Terracidiphilus sp.]
MRFSARTGWNTEENSLARAYRLRREAGLSIADLTASNPTRCGFAYPASLLSSLADERALDYDPQPLGLLQAREAVCRYYADHGVAVDPGQIVLTTSTSEAYSFLFRLLCDPGNEILVPQPGYPLFDFLAALDDVRIKATPLVYHDGWQIEFEALRRGITPQTRAIVVVHPNNPTGHFTKPWEVEELAKICRAHSLSLIVDEVFLDYREQGNKETRKQGNGERATPAGSEGAREQESGAPRSFAAGLDGIPIFVVSGLSKIAGLPQMKAAWIVATGPEKVEALERLEVIADTFLSMNAPVQWALPAWLAQRAEMQQQIQSRVSANLAELDRQLTTIPTLQRLAVEGGWYAILRVPALESDEQTVLALLERGVWAHPGYFFGLPDSGWLVLSLLGYEQEFRNGLITITDYFRTNQSSKN